MPIFHGSASTPPKRPRPKREPDERRSWTTADGTVVAFNHTKLLDFYRWMMERHAIFLQRQKDPAQKVPWTTDEKMKVKSCNVFRELDAVTQYELLEVIPNGSQEYEEMFFRVVLFRIFNKPETWRRLCDELGGIPTFSGNETVAPFTTNSYIAHCKSLERKWIVEQSETPNKGRGYSFSTGVYQMTAPGGKTKPNYELKVKILDEIMTPRDVFGTGKGGKNLPCRCGGNGAKNLAQKLKSLSDHKSEVDGRCPAEQAWRTICCFPMYGEFNAYQLLLDLNYIPALNFNLNDQWAATGPGSKACLELIFTKKASETRPIELMRFIRDQQFVYWDLLRVKDPSRSLTELPPSLPGSGRSGVGLVEIEHALCEYKKYDRGTEKAHKPSGVTVTAQLPPPKL